MAVKFLMSLAIPLGFLLLSGCASFQLSGDVQSGRQLLLVGQPYQALAHFQRAADRGPHYVADYTLFDESVWTYVGRAHYDLGEFEKARKALLKARAESKEDGLANVYLGLVLMRQGKQVEGLREAKVGLRSLKVWIRDLERYERMGIYWDPSAALENRIENIFAMIDGGDVGMHQIVSGLEWVGREFEEELDRALEDEYFDLEGDSQESLTG